MLNTRQPSREEFASYWEGYDSCSWRDFVPHAVYLGGLALYAFAVSRIDPEDQFWLDVRRTVLFCLVYPVQVMALDLTDPRAAALVRELTERASSAIAEMGALELVPRGTGR